MSDAKKLFEPIKIGNLVLENRIIMSAMVTNFATQNGFVTDRLIDYHVNIAKGGCALNVTGSAYVSLEGKRITGCLGAHDDKLLPGYRKLTNAVHAAGGRISQQISHGGRECSSEITGLRPIGPSKLVSRYRCIAKGTEAPREMSLEDIEAVVSKFGDAGRRACEGGFDAVEIHAAHGYLITQFLSPYSNNRTDRYGGDVVARSSFLCEIIQNVRKKAGPNFPILVKLNVQDYVAGGTTPDDAKVTAMLAAKAGANAIIASVGLHESRPYMIIPAMSVPPFVNLHLAALIKEAVDIPVAAVGRIIEPIRAAKEIEEGKTDLIALGRALLSDPEWPRKAQTGRFDDIRECIGCNQGCIDTLHKMKPFTCLQNPEIGREKTFKILKAKKSKNIAIIGGGPAGIEAARVSALRNHRVIIYEKEKELGGQIKVGKIPPHRSELGKVTDHLIRQIKKLGVSVELGKKITPAMLDRLNADAIIVATGALPLKPKIKGIRGKNVVCAVDVLAGRVSLGKRIVVVGAGLVGLETVDFCLEKEKEVIVLEMLGTIAADTGTANRVYFEERLTKEKVEVLLNATVTEIAENDVIYLHNGHTKKIMKVDTVVLAVGAAPNDFLWRILKGTNRKNVFVIGDCIKARNVLEAIYEGSKIAREI